MKYLLLLLALVTLAGEAHAQAASAPSPEPYCLPQGAVVKGSGSDYGRFETADVSGRVGWCPSSGGGWRVVVHHWCLRVVCDTPNPTKFGIVARAIDRVLAAADPAAQAVIEWQTWGIPLTTDLEKWQYRDWRYQACQWLTSTTPGAMNPRPPLPIAWPHSSPLNPDGTPWLPPPGYCDQWTPGAKPVPTVPPTLSPYIVTPAGGATVRPSYPVVAGKRSTTANGTATPGQPCDCTALQIIEFNVARYCAAPSITAPAPSVTACSPRPK